MCVCVQPPLSTAQQSICPLHHIHISAHAHPIQLIRLGNFAFRAPQQMRARVCVIYYSTEMKVATQTKRLRQILKSKTLFLLHERNWQCDANSSCLILFSITGVSELMKAFREVRATMTNLLGRMSLAQPNCFRASP